MKLEKFNKKNINDLRLINTILKDKSVLEYVRGIPYYIDSEIKDLMIFKGIEKEDVIGISIIEKYKDKCELKNVVLEKYRNKGYGKELLRKANNYVFDNLEEVKYCFLNIDDSNKASLSVAESIGFIKNQNGDYISEGIIKEQKKGI